MKMKPKLILTGYVASFARSPLFQSETAAPWEITTNAEAIVRGFLNTLSSEDFVIADEIAIHRSTIVESGAVLKGPLVLGPACFIASGAYLRGGNWLGERCVIGPGAELKSSFVFSGSKLAHFNFVGDSILGEDVNLEAGSIVCNYRNEREDKNIRVRVGPDLRDTGCTKFGALVGDHVRIGANAVVAPGAMLKPGSIVPRASVLDDDR